MPDAAGLLTTDAVRRRLGELLGTAVDTIAASDPAGVAATDGDGAAIRSVGQGSGGRSFVFAAGGRVLHVKLVRADSQRLLSLEGEIELLEALRGAGIAPAPVLADRQSGILVTEYVEGARPLQAVELARAPLIGAAARLLARLHVSAARPPVRSALSVAEHYLGRVHGKYVAGGEHSRLADELLMLAQWFERWPEPGAPCHGDPDAGNFLCVPGEPAAGNSGGDTLRLVDFEYAQFAPPAWDLAALSVMNGFVEADDALLLDAYYDSGAMPFSYRDFAKVRRLIALMAHFWVHAQGDAVSGIERYRLDVPIQTY